MAVITGDSPQAVAYALLEVIAAKEGKRLDDPTMGADRAWVLKTYEECLAAVLSIRVWGGKSA